MLEDGEWKLLGCLYHISTTLSITVYLRNYGTLVLSHKYELMSRGKFLKDMLVHVLVAPKPWVSRQHASFTLVLFFCVRRVVRAMCANSSIWQAKL